jgi:hypothetical protein
MMDEMVPFIDGKLPNFLCAQSGQADKQTGPRNSSLPRTPQLTCPDWGKLTLQPRHHLQRVRLFRQYE